MKKLLVFALVLGLVAGALSMPATAKKKKKKKPVRVERVATGTYQAPNLVLVGTCSNTDAIGCVVMPAAAGEKYLTVKITDAAGLPVAASIQQDQQPDAAPNPPTDDTIVTEICGEVTEPVKFDPSYELHVWISNVPTPDCPGAVATQGTVEITFSNLP